MSVALWSQFTPLDSLTSAAPGFGFIAAGQAIPVLTIVLLFVSGFLSWSLIEYCLHRFVFHYEARSSLGRTLIYHAHVAHHEDPSESGKTYASIVLSGPVAIVYWLLAWLVLGSWVSASFLFAGMASGWFCYKWVHHQVHHNRSRLRLMRYLRRYHLLHHHRTPNLRFGVTSPLFDIVFGTFRPVLPHHQLEKREQ